ncbi:hypothetical protein LEP1GSC194_0600 [Leptospira alstonii serovar Sichuan str. 79601]|uniref:Uncharacterized protein n=1 Tax=Leptospira alstonii serovar Sichuan str. 79601 TaxID=1218565 RepID=M6D989_9LEPT|nr:hypothetical protein LEP1GSC194_0600 [Leptospira alstonii serovar Sichuan str. 79601]
MNLFSLVYPVEKLCGSSLRMGNPFFLDRSDRKVSITKNFL